MKARRIAKEKQATEEWHQEKQEVERIIRALNKAILTEYSPKKKIKKSNQKNSFKNTGNSLSNLAKQLESGKGDSKLIEKEIKNLLSLKAIIKEQENE